MDVHERHTVAAKAKHCQNSLCLVKAMNLFSKVRMLEERAKQKVQVVKR